MTFRSRLFRWLMLAIAGYVVVLCWLMLFESKLVYPAPRGGVAVAADFGGEDITFNSVDGTKLHAWYFEKPGATETIVFFHGNAESIEHSGPWIGEFAASLNANALIFDYRGYGKSEGKPHQQGLVQDGLAAIQWLSNRTGRSSDQFVYFGRSLGGGVAIQVAREKPPKAFVLVSNFSSMVDVAANAYPWLPVRAMMRNRYESAATIAEMDVPLLQIHGDRDCIIPIELGRKLQEAAATTQKQFLAAAGKGHNDLHLEPFLSGIREFLDSLRQTND